MSEDTIRSLEETPWYGTLPQAYRLVQGEVLFGCPVAGWKREPYLPGMQLQDMAESHKLDVVVMSQDCDLANKKVEHAILCPHSHIDAFRRSWEVTKRKINQNPTPKAWARYCQGIRDGHVWPHTLLSELPDPWSGSRVVDFREVFSIPRTFLEPFARGHAHRIFLNPPYREHLSQAFARFFMRVGLPVAVAV